VLNRVYFRGAITKRVSFASGYSHLGKLIGWIKNFLKAQTTHQGKQLTLQQFWSWVKNSWESLTEINVKEYVRKW